MPNRGVEPLKAIMSFDPDGLGWGLHPGVAKKMQSFRHTQ